MTVSAFGIEHPGAVEKSASRTVGVGAGRFHRGVREGRDLVNQGHSVLGPAGSGVLGRKTYSVRPGMPVARRIGIHAGVVGSRPGTAVAAAAGAAGGASVEHRRKVAKTYQAGTITYQQERANLAARRKTSARRRTGAGTAAASAGVGGALLAQRHAGDVARTLARPAREIGDAMHAGEVRRLTGKVRRVGVRTGLGVAAAGAALGAEGLVSQARHTHTQNAAAAAAQRARRERNAQVRKAFDPEARRHKRQEAYVGATAGGSVAAGTSAVRTNRRAHAQARGALASQKQAAGHFKDARAQSTITGQRLKRHTTQGKGTLPATASNVAGTAATHHAQTASMQAGIRAHEEGQAAARAAWKTLRASRAKGALAAALGGASIGVARHDRRGGRSYSYR